MKALGIHVFAGGFTMGVKKVMPVVSQLETFDLGCETRVVPYVECEAEHWPKLDVDFAFGNPRCTGFSSITGGYSKETHGPWSKPTQDAHEFVNYCVQHKVPVFIWESVQQAYSVGRPLLNYFRDELLFPNDYRLCHLFVNAASFGNSQRRRRYFFVGYKHDLIFNVSAPELSEARVVRHAIEHLTNRKTHAANLGRKDAVYDFDTYTDLTPDEWALVPHLPVRFDLNQMGREQLDVLKKYSQKFYRVWQRRSSEMPFSMHGIHRIDWDRPSPTLHSSSSRIIHPDHNRTLTVGELATIMGWDCIPTGPQPVAQLVKGVVPAVGEWLAEQAVACLNNKWDEDWYTRYNDRTAEWEGKVESLPEKIIHMTRYV